jgi:hypothetical protein
MDNGTAIIIASLVPTVTSIVNRWLASRAERRAATLLAHNTELTLKIEKATNSMKDELVKATREGSLAQGALDERSRADAAKKE